MRLFVGQCKHCIVGRDSCNHRQEIRFRARQIKARGTLTHHCPVYYDVLPNGTKVRVVIMEIQRVTPHMEEPYPEWAELGEFEGVVDNPTKRKGFIRVKLDHPQDVSWPDGDDWHNPKTIEITHIHKRLNKIETCPSETGSTAIEGSPSP